MSSAESQKLCSSTSTDRSTHVAAAVHLAEAVPEERGVVPVRIEPGPLPVDEGELVAAPEHVPSR